MAAGITDKLWEIGSIVKVLEDWELWLPFFLTHVS
jgi:hypothetical protein